MEAFTLARPETPQAAASAASEDGAAFIAGGTDLMQLLKNNVVAPRRLIDIERLQLTEITATDQALRLGALASMADTAAHPAVRRSWPAISQALLLSASPQVRNMGTVGGNLLQRTRCGYFRDVGFPCNKRLPGSGCPAIHGENRELAVLGGSEHCIATHPSDMPVALVALDALVETLAPDGGTRTLRLDELYKLRGDAPDSETVLTPGELITAIIVPASPAAQHSAYLKVRDRASFAFALVSAAAGLDVQGGIVRDARIAMGGVGTKPWRMPQIEAALRGQPASDASFRSAALRAGEGAKAASGNAFKIALMPRVIERALRQAVA